MAYMRMAKVLLAMHILEKAGVSLIHKSIFDYGFGAGTFFRYCPASAHIAGVEMDPENVSDAQENLKARGFASLRLESISISDWEAHPLLQQQYDLFLCSHVLEHLPDPVAFLRRIRTCIKPGGFLVGLLPINERYANPHHIHACDQATIQQWAAQSGMTICSYLESDPWLYRAQFLFVSDTGARHAIAQAVSLALGIPATLCGHRMWMALSRQCERITGWKPTQAAFIARCDS